jgi:hypothetical protein
MESLSYKSEIRDTFSSVRDFSYQEKRSPLIIEERVNQFLDAILELKSKLQEKTGKLVDVNARMEQLTWFNNVDEEGLMVINDLIAAAKDLRSSLVRQYVSMTSLTKQGIAKQEIKDFKYAIDDLRESIEDLESVFFFLPEMPEFKETTKKLTLI